MQTKVHWCSVFNSFFVFHPGAQHRKHKKKLGQNFFENVVSDFEKNAQFCLKCTMKKKVFLKANFTQLLIFLFLFQSTLKAKLKKFFKILRPHFQNNFVQLFFMFSMLSSRIEHKKAIENGTPMYFCLHHEFVKKLLIFGHFCCFAAQFLIFLQIFSGVQKYVWQDVIHMLILAI